MRLRQADDASKPQVCHDDFAPICRARFSGNRSLTAFDAGVTSLKQ
jgi:hypothetical protein